jgi:hypothetical protein
VSVRETLELDIGSALASIEEMGSRLTNVAQAFGEVLQESMEAALSGLPIIKAEVDTESITEDVSQAVTEATAEPRPVEVTVEADASDITEAGDEAVSQIDTQVELSVSVDAEAVQQFNEEVSQTSVATDGAAQSLGDMDGALGYLGGRLSSAGGELGKFAGAASSVAGPVAIAAGAAIAASAGVKFLYDAAFESVAVTQQWENSLGSLAPVLESMEGGSTDLSGSIRRLAQDMGSSDEAVLLSIQRFALFNEAAGATSSEIDTMSSDIAALAAQVVANNPQLGTMDEVITALSRSLSRGGPRLLQYGIAMDANAISARAMEMGLGDATGQLSLQDKTIAGLSIAMEQLQPNQAAIAAGAENVLTKQRNFNEIIGDTLEIMGTPLVEPLTDAMQDLGAMLRDASESLVPLIDLFGQSFRDAIRGADATIGNFLRATAALVELLGDGADAAETGSKAFFGLKDALAVLLDTALDSLGPFGQLVGLFIDVGQAVGGTDEQVKVNAKTWDELNPRFQDAITLGLQAAAMFTDVGRETAWASIGMQQMSESANSNLPTVLSLFQAITAETTPDELKANLDAQVALTQQWTDTMFATQQQGFTNVTTLLAQLGPERSAMLVTMYGTQLADLEKHLAQVYAAEQTARAAVNELAVREFLRLRGITGAEADAIVGVFRANLQLGVPTAEELNAVIKNAETKKLAGMTAFGDFGSAVTKSVQDVVNETEGKAIADNLDKGLGDGLSKEQAQAVLRAAIYAQRVKDKINEILGVKSPSTEMIKTGYELARGLALGIEGNTGLVDTAIGRLGQSALGLSLTGAAGTAQAGNNIAITVPITVAGGMTTEDGARIGEAAGAAAADQLRRRMRLEALVA